MPRLNDTPRQPVTLAPIQPVQAQPQKVQHAHEHKIAITLNINLNLGTGEVHVSSEQDDHVEPLVPEFETAKIDFGKLS